MKHLELIIYKYIKASFFRILYVERVRMVVKTQAINLRARVCVCLWYVLICRNRREGSSNGDFMLQCIRSTFRIMASRQFIVQSSRSSMDFRAIK